MDGVGGDEMTDGSDATPSGGGGGAVGRRAALRCVAQPVDGVSFLSAADGSTRGYVVGEAWPPAGGGADQYRVISGPGDPPLDLDALVGNGGGEEGGEETIVYL